MKLEPHPKPWTHHHTHRLFHLSMGFCFGLAALAMIGMMVGVWFQASASTISDSHDLVVTATVEGVTPGPSSRSKVIGSYPKQTSNPTITIVADPPGQIPTKGASYVFDASRPAFSGASSVPNGLVFVTISGPVNFNGTAFANLQGNWYWKSPIDFPNGTYTARAAVFDSYDLTKSGSAQASFIINAKQNRPPVNPPGGSGNGNNNGNGGNTGNGGNNNGGGSIPGIPPIVNPPGSENLVFGIFFNVLNKYKYVTAGDKVVTLVTLVSNSDKPVTDQVLHYAVVSPKGETIMESSDTVSFSKQMQVQKTFYTAPKTPEGDYTIVVSGVYGGVASIASDTFRLLTPAATVGSIDQTPQKPVFIWTLMGLVWILFMVLVVIAYRYFRHHTREINSATTQV